MDTVKVEGPHQEVEQWLVVEDQHQEVEWPEVEEQDQHQEVDQWLVVEDHKEENSKQVDQVVNVRPEQIELLMEDALQWVLKCPTKKQKIENI